jgi:VCBS repeat-containing protein
VVATNTLIGVEALQFDDFVFYTDGRDNAVLFTGDDSGAVTEDAGTPATGTLTATDFDGSDGIMAVLTETASANGYGTFTVDAAGAWTYTLDDGNAAVDALNTGDTLTDSFDVLADDGTVQTVSITIGGADDAPVDTPASPPFTEGADTFTLSSFSNLALLPTVQIDGETWYQANMGGGTDQFWLTWGPGAHFIVSGGADADTFVFGVQNGWYTDGAPGGGCTVATDRKSVRFVPQSAPAGAGAVSSAVQIKDIGNEAAFLDGQSDAGDGGTRGAGREPDMAEARPGDLLRQDPEPDMVGGAGIRRSGGLARGARLEQPQPLWAAGGAAHRPGHPRHRIRHRLQGDHVQHVPDHFRRFLQSGCLPLITDPFHSAPTGYP